MSNVGAVRVVLILLLVGMAVSCSSPGPLASSPELPEWVYHSTWSEDVHLASWPEAKIRGLAIGFVQPADRTTPPYQRPSTHLFTVEDGEPFTTLLILAIGQDKPFPVLVSVFLDYEQVAFSLDSKQGLLHYLMIEPGVDMQIPLEVPIHSSGWHDLFVVVFPAPEFHPIDPQERLPPRLGAAGRRTVVCVGDCDQGGDRLPEALIGQRTTRLASGGYALPLLPDDGRPPQRRLLLSETARPAEEFALELWASNPGDRPRDYVVLPLLDFRQVPFADSPMLYLRMPPKSELFIPGRLRLPDERGVHELQFVYVFDPYHDVDAVTDPSVQSDIRTALVAEGGG